MQPKLFGSITLALLIATTTQLFGPSTTAAQLPVAPASTDGPTKSLMQQNAKEPLQNDAIELGSCIVKTANFADVTNRVKQEIAKHGAQNVLLVVDIDNTTLAMDQPLGSDQWYNWQYDFIFRNAESEFRVAKDLNELLRIQGILFTLGGMHPPEPEQPKLLTDVQQTGCSTIVLTSRGPTFRDATERELKRNGYDFSQTALTINEPTRGQFMPYDKARPNINGLSQAELKALRDPRSISYSSGIMMTAGQHKGYMLRTLLARSNRNFRAIVFADDHEKHTTRMTDAFSDLPITTACFHYVREQPNVDSFNEADKESVAKKWSDLDSSIRNAFESSK